MRILIVDDEKNIRRTLTVALESMEHEVSSATNSALALAELKAHPYDVVLLDLRLSQESGLNVLEEILQVAPRVSVVMVTAYASVETAVEAMRRGAFDYLPKPCTPDQVRQVLGRIEKTRKLERRVAELESRLGTEGPEIDLTSQSPTMQKALDVAFKAAGSEATVLLLGESGTGKSVLARAMHQRSPRRTGAFVTVSCPSLSRELLESDLFGHVKGAFTGAVADTQGKVAAADGGTLFLDEIGELPLEIQAKLLRLLQEREYERVGETKPRRANVRVISATNRDLTQAVAAGKFREDLFYRLNVISLRLPPLRERVNDIERLAMIHLRFLAGHSGKDVQGFSSEALEAMRQYAWPGNLREMRNIIERAAILCSGESIEASDLADSIQPGSEIRLGGKFTLEQIEAEHIRRVVANTRTLDEAAEVLGIDPATLYRKRKKL
ncbi:two component, sigma54 specific, transcriptional regulator, Fis family [Chthoniobacter flavus Ellin428]|uniref:Two component, sigma54 specific, transcriptional regulator, Fis family n=1 Tax=Chthoniobacter flavus Ellin428 TaxID=497964 RepID=B4CY78_9BACT|nr:sigma-54 dependent transcriptional regulator [Chthoniobacter flavus]EDY21226.1 two component, sigma54 specific, transcriptional regulator, Fis family [Chthoniobacter flavus Ellin428]TCO87594.1 NtrC-family two-component system response regulator AlgB [Chthoniobacter flavus]